MISLRGLFAGPERDFAKAVASREEAARILKISPEALEAFEEAYRKGAMNDEGEEGPENAKQAARAYSRMMGAAGTVWRGRQVGFRKRHIPCHGGAGRTDARVHIRRGTGVLQTAGCRALGRAGSRFKGGDHGPPGGDAPPADRQSYEKGHGRGFLPGPAHVLQAVKDGQDG